MGEAERVLQVSPFDAELEGEALDEAVPHLLALLERVDEKLRALGRLSGSALAAASPEERQQYQCQFEETRLALRAIVAGTTGQARALLVAIFARYPGLGVLPADTDS